MKPTRKYANIVNVKLVVAERVASFQVNSPKQVAEFVWPYFETSLVEVFAVLLLNSANGVVGFSEVTKGILNSSLVHPREIFQRAILANSASIILVHNHPSGNLEPSSEDQRITKQLVEGGIILGIPVVDHVILTGPTTYSSFSEKGLI